MNEKDKADGMAEKLSNLLTRPTGHKNPYLITYTRFSTGSTFRELAWTWAEKLDGLMSYRRKFNMPKGWTLTVKQL